MVYKFFHKIFKGSGILNLCQIINLHINFANQLLENLKEEEFILDLKTIFGELIWLICN